MMTKPGYVVQILDYHGQALVAAKCSICNAAIYPIDAILSHIARHGKPMAPGWFARGKIKMNKGGGRPKLKPHEKKKGGANINRRGRRK